MKNYMMFIRLMNVNAKKLNALFKNYDLGTSI